MITPSAIIKATGSDPALPVSKANILGRGHILPIGRVFKCAGLMGPNPNYAADSAAGLNPPAEILIQHIIMTLTGVPQDGREAGVVPSERCDEATWLLDPAQEAMDPTKPVCQVCGQGIVL